MKSMSLVIVLMISIVLLKGCGEAESTDPQTATVKKLLIPLYLYPADDSSWQPLIALKESYPALDIVAIVNDSNGEFSDSDSNYERAITQLHEANITAIGYVYTQYASRDITQVKENIDHWKMHYQSCGIEGIYVDEVSSVASDLPYYEAISNHARSGGLLFTVLNPGTKIETAYLDAAIADVIVSQESTYSQAVAVTRFNTPTAQTKLGLLLHGGDDAEIVSSGCEYANAHDFEYLYVTDDGADGNPWDSFSSYLERLADVMLQKCEV